jgi:hypothetical protein
LTGVEGYGSNGKVPDYPSQSPEFKPSTIAKKKKKAKNKHKQKI